MWYRMSEAKFYIIIKYLLALPRRIHYTFVYNCLILCLCSMSIFLLFVQFFPFSKGWQRMSDVSDYQSFPYFRRRCKNLPYISFKQVLSFIKNMQEPCIPVRSLSFGWTIDIMSTILLFYACSLVLSFIVSLHDVFGIFSKKTQKDFRFISLKRKTKSGTTSRRRDTHT
jgi:hypothetical protein